MSDPLFASRTARHDLPLLFPGQAQKEIYLNECLARLDALVHCTIEARTGSPPPAPKDGQCWLVEPGAEGAWSGHGGEVACYQQGQWLFQAPRDGLRLFDRGSGQSLLYHGTWKKPGKPTVPDGGSIIDSQARATIAELLDSLAEAGVIPHQ